MSEGTCTGLYPGWNYLKTSTEFPVPTGTQLEVTCYDGLQMTGSNQVTCQSDTFYIHEDEEPLCTPSTDDGWMEPKRTTYYDLSPSDNALQIFTTTSTGTDENTYLTFYKEKQQKGYFQIYFSSPPKYRMQFCEPQFNIFHFLPEEQSKLWTLMITKESMIAFCNDAVVANIVFADIPNNFCRDKWSTELTQLQVSNSDKATKNLRQLPESSCTALPTSFGTSIATAAEFPVPAGTKVTVTGDCKDGEYFIGSTELTCMSGTVYSFSRTPQCIPGEVCTGLHPKWNYLKTSTIFPVASGTEFQVSCDYELEISGSTSMTCRSGIFYDFKDGEPECALSQELGWEKLKKDEEYKTDMALPLQILSNTPVGSSRYLQLQFYGNSSKELGELSLVLASPPKYYVSGCKGTTTLPDFPTEPSQLWTILITTESLTVQCNDHTVINIVYGDIPNDKCSDTWSQEIIHFMLSTDDSISEYYRQPSGSLKSCTGFPLPWQNFTKATNGFPVSTGAKVTLTGNCPDKSRFFSSTEVTCLGGTIYSFSRIPQCIPEGNCTGLYPGWNYLKTSTEFPVPTGTQLEVTCYDGLQMTGSNQVTCHSDTFYIHEDEEPLCTPSTDDGWGKPQKLAKYSIDFAQSSLQILSNTPSNAFQRWFKVAFKMETEAIGSLLIKFLAKPTYMISYCQPSDTVFPYLPSATSKIWTIVKSRESVTVYCNDHQVINIVFSDIADDNCKDKWSQDVSKFELEDHRYDSHTSSDYYRQPTPRSCTGLPVPWTSFIETEELPVSTGAKVALKTNCPDKSKFFGSKQITCLGGRTYSFSRTPQCMPEGTCTGLYPGWNYLQTNQKFPVPSGTKVEVACYSRLQMSGSAILTCQSGFFFKFEKKPVCTPEVSDGWTKPVKDRIYSFKLTDTRSPLLVLSNTPAGTNRNLYLSFWNPVLAKWQTIVIRFGSILTYTVTGCQAGALTGLPDTPSKLWSLSESSDSLLVECNGIQVTKIVFSAEDSCNGSWSGGIDKITFSSYDSTSDYLWLPPLTGEYNKKFSTTNKLYFYSHSL